MSEENNNKNEAHSKHIGGSEPPRRRHQQSQYEPKKRTHRHVHPPKEHAPQTENKDIDCSVNSAENSTSSRRTHAENNLRPATVRPAMDDGRPKEGRQKSASRRQNDAKSSPKRNPRELVVDTLVRVEAGGYSNIVWDLAVRRANLSNLDKVLATRIYYGTLSNIRYLDALWNSIEPEMSVRADSVVKMALRSAMYQLIFLDRVPAYSIVSTTVDVVKRMRNRAASGYCNALLRKAVRLQEAGDLNWVPTGDRLQDFAVKYSLNDDIAALILREFGDQADDIADSMLSVPRMILRVNRSRTSMEALMKRDGFEVTGSEFFPEQACAVLRRHDEIEASIDRGDVCVQDEAAQMAVHAMGRPESWGNDGTDVKIWDACAGHGGKSIHLLDEIACDSSSRKYKLLSTDLYESKLEHLKDYQHKFFPSQHLYVKARDLTLPGSVPMAPFDAVLVDAPCSGLGVLRRHPEVKLSRTAADIESLVNLQGCILDNVCRHVRVGGILVYAVCTVTGDECENRAAKFLADHPNFAADTLPDICLRGADPASQIKLLPHKDGCDGFFVARFIRKS